MKKLRLILLSLLLCVPPTLHVKAVEFEGKEDYYTDLCKNTESLSKSDIQVCESFSNYLKDKNAEIENQIAQTEQSLSQTLASIEETENQLAKTDAMITSVENEIAILEAAIIQTTDEIIRKEQQLADRMYFLQSYVNGNEYLYLLLSSNSLDQLLTRIQNIDELTEYDKDLISGLAKAKQQLEEDKEEANLRYNDLFVLHTQQTTLLNALGSEAASYNASLDEIRDTLAGNRVDIGFIDDSLTEAEKRIQAEEDRKKAEEEAKREEENKKQEEENKPQEDQNNNDSSNNPPSPSTPSSSNVANGIISTAKSKLGCSYVYGGTGPNVFDCSGFAQWVYRQNGIYIPRTVSSQYYACELVSDPQPGDLLFFNTTGYLGHVGIYIGGDLFIHAGTSKTGVCYGNLTYAYWINCYQGVGRFR